MNDFIDSLISAEKSPRMPDEFDYFGRLVGSWTFDYTDCRTDRKTTGEWHFSRVLEGMAIQDVIILPSRQLRKSQVPDPLEEYGVTLRLFNPSTKFWDIVYCYTGKIMRLEARKENEKIVLTDLDNERRKWVFIQIGETSFHWQNITVQDDGGWQINADLRATRSASKRASF